MFDYSRSFFNRNASSAYNGDGKFKTVKDYLLEESRDESKIGERQSSSLWDYSKFMAPLVIAGAIAFASIDHKQELKDIYNKNIRPIIITGIESIVQAFK